MTRPPKRTNVRDAATGPKAEAEEAERRPRETVVERVEGAEPDIVTKWRKSVNDRLQADAGQRELERMLYRLTVDGWWFVPIYDHFFAARRPDGSDLVDADGHNMRLLPDAIRAAYRAAFGGRDGE